jgi:hypothetical protein
VGSQPHLATLASSQNRVLRGSRATWAAKRRHLPIPDQQKTLKQKLQGHYNYYGITGNSKALGSFLYMVIRLWKKWLGRRSQKAEFNWPVMERLLKRYPLPRAIAKRSALRWGAATPVV